MNGPDTRLSRDGPPIRISDVMAITGLSRTPIFAAMQRGDLVGFRLRSHPGSPWLFERAVVADWLDQWMPAHKNKLNNLHKVQ